MTSASSPILYIYIYTYHYISLFELLYNIPMVLWYPYELYPFGGGHHHLYPISRLAATCEARNGPVHGWRDRSCGAICAEGPSGS